MPKRRDEWTAEEWRETTTEARRAARFTFAAERIRKIVDGMPPLNDQQLSRLAALLRPEAGPAPPATASTAGEVTTSATTAGE